MTDNIPGLSIEANDDGTLTLQQDWSGNVDRVAVHPVHVRHLAERLGLIREASACDADNLRTAGELQRDNDRMRRNLLQIREQALELQKFMATLSDWQHADLSSELERVNNLVGLLDMACGDFANDDGHSVPIVQTGQSQSANAVVTVTTNRSPATPKPPAEAPAQLELPA